MVVVSGWHYDEYDIPSELFRLSLPHPHQYQSAYSVLRVGLVADNLHIYSTKCLINWIARGREREEVHVFV